MIRFNNPPQLTWSAHNPPRFMPLLDACGIHRIACGTTRRLVGDLSTHLLPTQNFKKGRAKVSPQMFSPRHDPQKWYLGDPWGRSGSAAPGRREELQPPEWWSRPSTRALILIRRKGVPWVCFSTFNMVNIIFWGAKHVGTSFLTTHFEQIAQGTLQNSPTALLTR